MRGEGDRPSLLVSQLRATGLTLDTVNPTEPSADADVWERVILKLRTGSMPPAGSPRPDAATYHALASWLETEIDRAAAASPNPGRTHTVHRLNRTEYRNAIRDLFALDIDVVSLLPGGRDLGHRVRQQRGRPLDHDGPAGTLPVSGRKITRLATGLPPTVPGFETFDVHLLLVQDDRQSDDLRSGPVAATRCAITFRSTASI